MSEHPEKYTHTRGLISLMLIIGFVSGGVSGALVSQLSSHSLPKGVDEDLSVRKAQTFIVEESSTIDTVGSASESVVSIIIEKPARAATGNISSPFFFDFGIPGLEVVPNQEEEPVSDFDTSEEEEEYIQVGGGTGFVVNENGLILTNKHVISDEDARYSVVTSMGEQYEVEILGVDPVNDLAVVKIKDNVTLPYLELGDSDAIQIGQTVLAIGNSLGEFDNTVTRGVISGVNRRVVASDNRGSAETLESVIQTDAAINPGNSGGPLLNLAGQVIGVNTAVSQSGQLIGFAIPINDAIRLVESIEKYGRVVRPYLGVRYIMLDSRIAKSNNLDIEYGALLRRGDNPEDLAVVPGGPADIAGLEENDIILEVNGQKIDENNSLVRTLSKYVPGDSVSMKVLKDGEEVELSLTLGEFDTNQE